MLFSGSLKLNLDPTGQKTNEDLWRACSLVRIQDAIESLPMKLNTVIAEGGENFLPSQRQLLCIARAILRRPKILILDEATSLRKYISVISISDDVTVDAETDAYIQQMLKRELSDSTIITVSHKVQSLLESDKIIIMDRGQVVEFDTPRALLKNSSGVFYSMLQDI